MKPPLPDEAQAARLDALWRPLKPLAIDLYAGLGGWSEGLLAEGWQVVGVDIEEHIYGEHRYPAGLIIQDVRTVEGAAFSKADLIVASPPCQEYSYMAMPWQRAKAKAAAIRADETGAELERLNELFNECFRIQREASAAKGEHIPLIVENVRGAQPWVGRARWSFGSFFLWGDVPALMPMTLARKNNENGGSWFVPPPGRKCAAKNNPDGRKLPGFRFDGSGRSFQSASVEGVKVAGLADGKFPPGGLAQGALDNGVKAVAAGGIEYGGSFGWDGSPLRRGNSKSPARKFASAMIAKIPLALSRHIAATFHPRASEAA